MKSFDIAISFAGENRSIAQDLAKILKQHGLLVFYDDDEQAELIGENLTEYLADLYKNKASYCIVLVSEQYIKQRWCRHEWRAAQARAFEDFDQAYILPIRIDEAELPGMLSTVGFLSLKLKSLDEIAQIIKDKVEGTARVNGIVRKAHESFRTGDFQSVISALSDDSVYSNILNDRIAIRLLADAYMTLANYIEAISVFEDITSHFQTDAESYFLLGICQYRTCQFQKAIPNYEKALQLAPNHKFASRDLKRAKMLAWLEMVPGIRKLLLRRLSN